MEIKINNLTLEGLKEYKLKSPSKFADKFGDLDLDNLPPNWDINAHRRAIINKKEKPPLIRDANGIHIPENTIVELPKEVTEVFNKVTEISEVGSGERAEIPEVTEVKEVSKVSKVSKLKKSK